MSPSKGSLMFMYSSLTSAPAVRSMAASARSLHRLTLASPVPSSILKFVTVVGHLDVSMSLCTGSSRSCPRMEMFCRPSIRSMMSVTFLSSSGISISKSSGLM